MADQRLYILDDRVSRRASSKVLGAPENETIGQIDNPAGWSLCFVPAVCLTVWSNDTLKHVYEKRQCKFTAGNNGFVPAAVIGYLKVHGQGTLEETAEANTERGWCASFVCAYEGILYTDWE